LREKKLSIDITYGWSFTEQFEIEKTCNYETLFEHILQKSSLCSSLTEKRMYWIFRYDNFKEEYIPVAAEKK